MEASQDPFGQQAVSGTAEDPFAAADAEFQQGDDPFGGSDEVTEQPRPGVPVVGADGAPKEASEAADARTQDGAAEETEQEAGEREAAEAAVAENDAEFDRVMSPEAEADPTPGQTGPDGEALTAPAGAEAASNGAHGEEAGATAEDPTPAPVSGAQEASPAAEVASAPAAQTSPSPASATESDGGNGQEAADAGAQAQPTVHPDNDEAEAARAAAVASEEEEVEERQPETNKKGETVRRPYLIFVPDGKGKWREVTWWEAEDGKMVPQGTNGAKKQRTCVVRGQEEALRIGYRALGSPPEGIGIVAVAANYFRLRQVEPDVEPQPRQRLKIR